MKPQLNISSFNCNNVQYKSKFNKNKNLSLSEYLDKIYHISLILQITVTKTNNAHKIQLTLRVFFHTSKYIDDKGKNISKILQACVGKGGRSTKIWIKVM